MPRDRQEERQRAILEDLVRIRTVIRKLAEEHSDSFSCLPGSGSWSVAEHVLHLVLTLEDCHRRFAVALEAPQPMCGPTWTERLASGAVLASFRFPAGLDASEETTPGVIMGAESLLTRAAEAIAPLAAIERRLRSTHDEVFVSHPHFGPLTLSRWARLLLIHALHHKRLVQNML